MVLASSSPVFAQASLADLMIIKNGPSSAHEGDMITYTFTIANFGPNAATNVVVNDPLLGGTIWGPAGLLVGEDVTFSVTYIVPIGAPDPLSNTATVVSGTLDPNPANNQYLEMVDLLTEPAPPPGPVPQHVGGQVFSANKLAVLSPYLALLSVIAVAAVVAKRMLT